MTPYKLLLKQTSAKLSPYKGLTQLQRPTRGWIHAVREALGMTTAQLAKRLGVAQPSVFRFEKAEANDAITLKSLRSAAHAMNCELVYAIVPRSSLEETIQQQAEKLAKKRLGQVTHHMTLEDQALNEEQQQEMLQDLVNELLTNSPKKLWK